MGKLIRLNGALLLSAALLMAACSPEQGRIRGERGADIGNRPKDSAAVDIHGRTDSSFDVRLVGRGIKTQDRR